MQVRRILSVDRPFLSADSEGQEFIKPKREQWLPSSCFDPRLDKPTSPRRRRPDRVQQQRRKARVGCVQLESAPREESQIQGGIVIVTWGKDGPTQSCDIKKEGRTRNVFNNLQPFMNPRSYYIPGKGYSIPLKGRKCFDELSCARPKNTLEHTSRDILRLDIRNILSKDNIEPPDKTSTLVWERKQ
jgi:hypothetical protein